MKKVCMFNMSWCNVSKNLICFRDPLKARELGLEFLGKYFQSAERPILQQLVSDLISNITRAEVLPIF